MLIQIFLTLILMLVYFTVFYNVGIPLSKLIGRRVCVTCYSVSLTWLTLLALQYSGIFAINKYLIAVLIAQSAVGISNLSEEFIVINQVRVSQTLLKFGTILYGTFAVLTYSFVLEVAGLVLVIPLMCLGILSMVPVNETSPITTRSKELLIKLKNCCG